MKFHSYLFIFLLAVLSLGLVPGDKSVDVGVDDGFEPFLVWIDLDVPSGSYESVWCDKLAERFHAKQEVILKYGRADLITDEFAIEVDRDYKWKEGLGQALYYAQETGLRPMVSLIQQKYDREYLEGIAQVLMNEQVSVVIIY